MTGFLGMSWRCFMIKDGRLKGFFMAPRYYRTQEDSRTKIMESLDVMAEAINGFSV